MPSSLVAVCSRYVDVSSRRLVASSSAVSLFIVAGIGIGCEPVVCGETLTCPIVGDDVVVASERASEASDDVVGTTDAGIFDSSDVVDTGDETADANESAADVNEGAADGPTATDAAAEANGGRDAQPDATPEAGLTCGSNVLVPTGAVASTLFVTTPTDLTKAAVDGNLSTRWNSAHADPQWIYLDFGAPIFVDRVQILWQHCATNYALQVSNDASTWTTMASIVGNTSGTENPPSDWSGAVDTTRLAGVGRYVRVSGTVRCVTVSGYSIWEMQVYGDTNTNCVP
jgi:hypothetical protein